MLFLAAAYPALAAEPSTTVTPTAFTNRLAREKSPYLLQHQHNPVDWYPWGPEAFAKAKAEGKPIFLSVGYSTCHWCHVMAHESFENAATAKLMNALFVCVKVDREERPDVDRVYMTYVQATTGGGGWPMSVFLTPDLQPFFGGTYFPPADRGGRPGFPTVLQRLSDAWKDDHAEVVKAATGAMKALGEYTATGASKSEAAGKGALAAGFNQLARSFDDELGGFGSAPKFPRPVALNFLLRIYAREGAQTKDGKAALAMTLHTLREMAAGGMHDHLGGGFHRYSVDRFWHVPHFEKMLYDQAQLACSYLEAFQITHDPAHEKVARDILDYVRRDMTDQGGGFYSAEDADSLVAHGQPEHSEGAFYVWKKAEIDAALGEEAAQIFNRVYGVQAAGNAPEGSDPMGEFKGANILIERVPLAEAAKHFKKPEAEVAASLAASRMKLLDLRARRPRPHLDDKIITSWNGLMISAFARGAQVLDDPAYLVAAQKAARFIRAELWKKGALLRSYRQGAGEVAGFCDDYATLIQGLLDLYEADFDTGWLQWALELQGKQDALFGDPEHGGYFSVEKDAPHILLRMKEDYDGAEPSPNSVAALNLLRLAQLTDRKDFRDRAEKTLAAFAEQLTKAPTALPQMLVALDASLAKPRQVVIAGPRDDAATRALLRETHAHFIPNKLVLLADGGAGQQWLGERLEFVKTVGPVKGQPAAFVCENFVCQLPTSDVEKLRALLAK
ncbi:MAG: thioredoxin domain-containing protein [Chthoniobacter sp.]|nr:thioredoxin domain-containing protein [Chthoniobacter sp.]